MVTLQFLPYSQVENMTGVGRIRKLLNLVKEDKIVLLQGRLHEDEEAELIKATMEEINKNFRGIELAVVNPSATDLTYMQKFRQGFTNFVLGDRQGITVIGPASVVKSIKRDPNKIELLMKNGKVKRKNGRK
ncbi:DUF2073 domain-containing protein [Candidatus Woesearchaeota archaeon]|nr:DUF2073 domain-containing protein [Candidatus Woesearchaeota archaeon]